MSVVVDRGDKRVCIPSLVEASFVVTVLLLATILSGGRSADWISCVAVFLTFLHSQAAFNLAELSPVNGRGASASRYHTAMFLMKEGFWVLTFLALGSYPLLVSSFLLSTYPLWRRRIRALNYPSESTESLVQARS